MKVILGCIIYVFFYTVFELLGDYLLPKINKFIDKIFPEP